MYGTRVPKSYHWRGRLPGRTNGSPTGPPTDPYVRNERIRFLGHQSCGTTLAHHCAALHSQSDVVDEPGEGEGRGPPELCELLPLQRAFPTTPTQPVPPRPRCKTPHLLQQAEGPLNTIGLEMPASLRAEHLLLVYQRRVPMAAAHRHRDCLVRRSRLLAVLRCITQNPRRDFVQEWVNPRTVHGPFPQSAPGWASGFLNAIIAVFVGCMGSPKRATRFGSTAIIL